MGEISEDPVEWAVVHRPKADTFCKADEYFGRQAGSQVVE
jgi:hypothetical protein